MTDYSQAPCPAYILDEALLRRNLTLIARVAREAGVRIIPAFKGFSMWGVFPVVREYVSGASASSLWEARLATEEMHTLAHTYSPAYDEATFAELLACSSHVTFNSLTQYRRFEPMVRDFNKSVAPGRPEVSMGLRFNPEYSKVATELYNPCSPGSRLGIPASGLPEELPEGIEGLHIHALCESPAEETARLIEAIESRSGAWLDQLRWINLGGGHLMTRQDYDIPLLIHTLKTFRGRHPGLEVILEPGSAFAWETGVLVARVEDIVENHGIRTAILNVSFTAHMPDCLEMPYKPRISGATDEATGQTAGQVSDKAALGATDTRAGFKEYRMGGNSCLAGDYVGNWIFDHELAVGERIVFEDMIHYTMVKTTTFNGVAHPALAVRTLSGNYEVLRTFSYEDYKSRLS
jgi:carboxynorspermidine decarboxylase